MIRRIKRAWRNLLIAIGLLPLMLGCAHGEPACSPSSALAIDLACAHAVVDVVERECPDVASVSDCPPAVIALAACDEAIAAHARRCSL